MSNPTTMQTCDEDTMQKCDECGMTGHPSTDCNNGKVVSFNLFGVQIDPNLSHEDDCNHQGVTGGSIRKCKSMEILNVCNNEHTTMDRGYLSDEHPDNRKKGVPWTEDEHRSFLIGLEKLGKGDWRGISKNYVPSRTPTQVASHAQKYFIRMNASQEKSKRRSLFDMPSNESPKVPIAPTIATSARPPPPVSRINRTYDVRDYANYMRMGYQNRNEQRIGDLRFSSRLSLLPVPLMNFPDQGRAYPPNSGLPTIFMARSPFVSHVPLPTHKSWVEKDNRRME